MELIIKKSSQSTQEAMNMYEVLFNLNSSFVLLFNLIFSSTKEQVVDRLQSTSGQKRTSGVPLSTLHEKITRATGETKTTDIRCAFTTCKNSIMLDAIGSC